MAPILTSKGSPPLARLVVAFAVVLAVTGAWCALVSLTVSLARRVALPLRTPVIVAAAAAAAVLTLWVAAWVMVLTDGHGPEQALVAFEQLIRELLKQPKDATAWCAVVVLPFLSLALARGLGPVRWWREALAALLGGAVAAAMLRALLDAPAEFVLGVVLMPVAASLGLRLADRVVDRLFPPPPAEGDAPTGPAIG
ncbi:MAG: hypothetical protein M9894_06375 [Planctomycetes bacterium]|nr:hypothetical protein [Planctomycetota bacterium]